MGDVWEYLKVVSVSGLTQLIHGSQESTPRPSPESSPPDSTAGGCYGFLFLMMFSDTISDCPSRVLFETWSPNQTSQQVSSYKSSIPLLQLLLSQILPLPLDSLFSLLSSSVWMVEFRYSNSPSVSTSTPHSFTVPPVSFSFTQMSCIQPAAEAKVYQI